MRNQAVLGAILIIAGLLLLFLLRDLVFKLIEFIIGFFGIMIAIVLIFGGLSMIFWRPRFVWRVK